MIETSSRNDKTVSLSNRQLWRQKRQQQQHQQQQQMATDDSNSFVQMALVTICTAAQAATPFFIAAVAAIAAAAAATASASAKSMSSLCMQDPRRLGLGKIDLLCAATAATSATAADGNGRLKFICANGSCHHLHSSSSCNTILYCCCCGNSGSSSSNSISISQKHVILVHARPSSPWTREDRSTLRCDSSNISNSSRWQRTTQIHLCKWLLSPFAQQLKLQQHSLLLLLCRSSNSKQQQRLLKNWQYGLRSSWQIPGTQGSHAGGASHLRPRQPASALVALGLCLEPTSTDYMNIVARASKQGKVLVTPSLPSDCCQD